MNLICKPHDNKKANLKRKIVTLNKMTGDVSIYFITYIFSYKIYKGLIPL